MALSLTAEQETTVAAILAAGRTLAWPASAPQVRNVVGFRDRKVITPVGQRLLDTFDAEPSKRNAGAVLDYLFDASTEWLPRPAAAPALDTDGATVVEPVKWDVFRATDGRVVKVERAQAGHLYGKVLDETCGEWDYLPRFRDVIAGGRRLTLDEAAAISAQWHRCVRCNRKITLAESIDRGMGAKCASYFS